MKPDNYTENELLQEKCRERPRLCLALRQAHNKGVGYGEEKKIKYVRLLQC